MTAASKTSRERLIALSKQLRTFYVLAFREHELRKRGVLSDYGSRPIARYDGGKDSAGYTFKPLWPKVAEFVLANGLDGQTLVNAVFRSWDETKPPPPNLLLSRRVLSDYAAYAEFERHELANLLNSYQVRFQTEVYVRQKQTGRDTEAAAAAVIEDGLCSFSPLFRYCMAEAAGHARLAAKFHDSAFQQYLLRRTGYDQTWGDVIPAQLRTEAERFVAGLARK